MPDDIAQGAAVAEGTEGRLVTWSVIRKAPEAFAGEPLYAVAVVDLPDGRRVTGRLAHFDADPALGIAVKVTGAHRGVPVFEAA